MNTSIEEALSGIANQLRIHSIEATTAAGSGHPTSCCSAADLVAALFFGHMRYDPKNPHYLNNDRFILSKGHAAPLLYAAWAENGLFPREHLLTLRQLGSDLEGHPTPRLAFADVATGSLGQGLGVGVGMALCARLDKLDYHTYVLMGDGEIAEGAVWEAASLAGINQVEQSHRASWTSTASAKARPPRSATTSTFTATVSKRSAGASRTSTATTWKKSSKCSRGVGLGDKPLAIIAKTYKGAGVSFMQDKDGWHGKPLNKEEAAKAIAELAAQAPNPASA